MRRHARGGLRARRARLARRLRRLRRPAVFGTLRRVTPLSEHWGSDRGQAVDRYYIEAFLAERRAAIRGRVLEVHDARYTRRFGDGVERSDVLDVDPSNPRATIVADLAAADAVPAGTFDCIVLTQTLQYVYDVGAAIAHCHRILRPGGVLLCTVPVTSRISRGQLDRECWRFTAASCRRLFGEAFGTAGVEVRTYGNVLAGIAFLAGVSREELRAAELDAHDPYFPLIVAVRAQKRG